MRKINPITGLGPTILVVFSDIAQIQNVGFFIRQVEWGNYEHVKTWFPHKSLLDKEAQ